MMTSNASSISHLLSAPLLLPVNSCKSWSWFWFWSSSSLNLQWPWQEVRQHNKQLLPRSHVSERRVIFCLLLCAKQAHSVKKLTGVYIVKSVKDKVINIKKMQNQTMIGCSSFTKFYIWCIRASVDRKKVNLCQKKFREKNRTFELQKLNIF